MRADGRPVSHGSGVRLRKAGALALAFVFAAGCRDKTNGNATVDAELARDLQLAGQTTTAPIFQDTALNVAPATSRQAERPAPRPTPTRTARSQTPRAQTPTPVAQAPRPQVEVPIPAPLPAPSAAPSSMIAAGTGIAMTANSRVCTQSNRPGDKIVATVTSAVTGSNGAVIPAGSKVVLEIVSVNPGQGPETSEIVFRVRALYVGEASYTVAGTVSSPPGLEKVKIAGEPGADKKKVVTGAIAGAVLGQILGRSTKSTVIGAATGAAAGAVMAKAGEHYEGCMAEGSALRLTLAEPLAMN
jgi:hypothetical protein